MHFVRTAWFVGLATLSSFSFADRIDWITTPTKTYVVTPAKVVAEGSIIQTVWSDDNKAALILVQQPSKVVVDGGAYLDWLTNTKTPTYVPTTNVLAEWDKSTGLMKMVWQPESLGTRIAEISWFKNSHKFMFATSVPDAQDQVKENCAVWIGQGMQDSVRPKALVDGLTAMPGLYFAPGAPRVVLDEDLRNQVVAMGQAPESSSPTTLHLAEYSDNGDLLSRHEFTSDPKDGLVIIRWNKAGNRYHLDRYVKRKVVERIALTDSGPQVLTDETDYVRLQLAVPTFTIAQHSVPLKYRKSKAMIGGTWLSASGDSMHPELLITTGRARVETNPAQDTIFITQNGVISSRTIVNVPDSLLAKLYQDLKAQSMNSAKQLGLGMLMFAGDNDDALPGGDSAGDDISPYLKDDDLLGDLNYTPPTDLNMTNIQSPAETVIGYVDGPGGRADIYSDGHVRWRNNP